ncbi:MAG TPA: small ribosomal subunit Rsm22 family protein [Polyangiaceae bacterium]|nr:small ribosomal subunit Rsm22 family protein [Polyangiaceae bacterium]
MSLVRPLEDDWRDTLDAIARRRRWPTSGDVARLADCIVDLSRAYNDAARARASVSEAGAARLAFSFVRDVPKGAAAVRELVAAGAIAPRAAARSTCDATSGVADDSALEEAAPDAHTTLRILDVGAGFGAMTWGILRALRAAGATCRLDATWLDDDAAALEVGSEIVRERRADLRLRGLARSLDEIHDTDLGRFDLVVLGNVLSEVGIELPDEARILQHVEIVRTMLEEHVDQRGAVIVVEPALRDRTRRLHRVRDGLVRHGISVFAPCLHSSPCPALAHDSDWCHEDLPVDLPQWLAPVARAAGLRRQGLTFSYLVLTKDGSRLADVVGAARAPRLRVVSERQVTKGKCEAFLCGEFRSDGSAPAVARARVARLDRDRTAANEDWGGLGRGDVLEVDPAPALERPRIGRTTEVRRIETIGARGRVESH